MIVICQYVCMSIYCSNIQQRRKFVLLRFIVYCIYLCSLTLYWWGSHCPSYPIYSGEYDKMMVSGYVMLDNFLNCLNPLHPVVLKYCISV